MTYPLYKRSNNKKSTIAFHTAKVATKLGCLVLLVDVEGTANSDRLEHLGIDTSRVMVKQPDESAGVRLTVEEVGRTIEQAMDVFQNNYPEIPIVIIWDSVGQTPSADEMDKDFGDRNVGSRAKSITQLVYKLAPKISETKSLFIGINQVRDDIGGNPMFPTYSVPGGNAWEHYASLRIEIKQKKAIKQGDERVGHTMGVNVRKSKVSRPFQEANGFLISDNGIDYEYNLVEMAKEEGIVQGKSRSFEYVDINGEIHKKVRQDFIEWLRTPEGQPVREEILNRLMDVSFPNGYPAQNNKNLDIDKWVDKVHPPFTFEKKEPEEKVEDKKAK